MLYIRVLQIPVCVLLLVQLPPRNQLCLMEFLIVCPEFESLKLLEILSSASSRRRQGKVLHLSTSKTSLCLALKVLNAVYLMTSEMWLC